MKRNAIILLMILFVSETRSQNAGFVNESYEIKNMNTNMPASFFVSNAWSVRKEIKKNYDEKISEHKNKGNSKIYVKLNAGFGFFTPGSYNVKSVASFLWDDQGIGRFSGDTTVKTQTSKGIGAGFRYGGGIGYVLNDFINIGIDAEYNQGSKLSNTLNVWGFKYGYDSTNDKMDYKTMTLTPYIIFKALARPNYFIYNKLGILFTLPSTLNASGNSTSFGFFKGVNQHGVDTILIQASAVYAAKYKISLGVGINVAFGINIRLNSKFRVFGEVFGNYTALSPSRSSISNSYTNYITDNYDSSGIAVASVLQSSSRNSVTNTIYKSGGPVTAVSGPNGTVEAQSHKYTINMAVLGMNVGIIYRF